MEDRGRKIGQPDITKNLATGYIAGDTIHAVLNYLTGIRGYVDMLLTMDVEESNKTKALEAIERSERKCSDLLIRFLDFYGDSAGKTEPVDLNEIIDDTLKLTWPMAKYSNIEIVKVLGEEIPPIIAGRQELVQVFAFIIINLAAVMADEGVLKIETNYDKEDSLIKIIISNTKAVPEEALPLDLSKAYKIIKSCNGSIDFRKAAAAGSAYTIEIPFA